MTTIQHDEASTTRDTARRDRLIPAGHTVTSAIGMGPIPFTKIVSTHAMVTLDRDNPAPAGTLTHTETSVRAAAEKKAQHGLDRTVTRHIEPMIATIKDLHAQINLLDRLHSGLKQAPLTGPDGEVLDIDDARHAHTMDCQSLEEANRSGSHRHHQHRRHPWRETGLLLLDYPVFLYAMMGLLNVSILRAFSFADTESVIRLGIAATFALMGTLLLAVTMRFMGRRHRDFKTDTGTLPTTRGTGMRIEVIGTAAVAVAAATVMATRVLLEGLHADGNLALSLVLAVFFALLVLASCYLNYRAQFDNGSPLTDRINHESAVLRHRHRLIDDNRTSRQLTVEAAGKDTAALHRAITEARSKATKEVTTSRADKAIALARSYTSTTDPIPAPGLDFARLDQAAEQASQLADHQRHLEDHTTNELTDDDLYRMINEEN